jgi:hypothetical protein
MWDTLHNVSFGFKAFISNFFLSVFYQFGPRLLQPVDCWMRNKGQAMVPLIDNVQYMNFSTLSRGHSFRHLKRCL